MLVLLLSDVPFYHLGTENVLLFLTFEVVSSSELDLVAGTLRSQFFI